MLRNRPLLAALLLAAVSLLTPALSTASKPAPAPKSCTLYFCPSAGLHFICCPSMPDCPCQTCPDFC